MEVRLVSDSVPKGDQPEAKARLVENLTEGVKDQALHGITSSGKTFTIPKRHSRNTGSPTLVPAHDKTLAARLYRDFPELK